MRPSTSVRLNSSYEATASSPDPSAARIRGRSTGTRRPPRVTDPAPLPWRTPVRAGSCLPLGPHAASRSAVIIAAITCSPVPTRLGMISYAVVGLKKRREGCDLDRTAQAHRTTGFTDGDGAAALDAGLGRAVAGTPGLWPEAGPDAAGVD